MIQTTSKGKTPSFDDLPDTAFVRQKTLITDGLIPFSAASLWRKVKSREFPAPVKVSEQITAWRVSDIRYWQKSPDTYAGKKSLPIAISPKSIDSECGTEAQK